MESANSIAWLALLAWAPFTLVLFARLRAPLAATISIFGAQAFLPNGLAFDAPLVPPLDREVIAVVSSFIGCVLFAPSFSAGKTPGRGIEMFALLMVLGAVGTALTNGDAIYFGVKYLAPLSAADIVSLSGGAVLSFWLPFYLGRCLFRKAGDLRIVLGALAVGAFFYSVLVLWEIRMSPNLHVDLYGYSAARFLQAKRGGIWGWRPMVFVGHGLQLTMFLLTCTLAAGALWRMRSTMLSGPLRLAAPYLYGVLFLCQSLASFVYGTVALLALLLFRTSFQAYVILAIALIVLTYPVTRALDFFPTESILQAFERVDPDRADSLEFRFDNEDLLIERASERALFGWGGYGRSRLYDEDSGDRAVVTDGYWVIVLGQRGIVGFLTVFGLLVSPVLVAARALMRGRPNTREAILVAGTTWIGAVCAVDLLPNASITSGTVYLMGGLLGAVQGWRAGADAPKPRVEETPPVAAQEVPVSGPRLHGSLRELQ